jgi:hypothetical protein
MYYVYIKMRAQSKYSFVFMPLLWRQFVSYIVGIEGTSGDSLLLINVQIHC